MSVTFTAAEVTDLAEILQTNSDVLGLHLMLFAGVITETDKDKVLGLVEKWNAEGGVGNQFVKVLPNDKNFGADIDPEREKSDIRAAISNLLQFPVGGRPGGGGTRLVRG